MKDKIYLGFIGLCIVAMLSMMALGPQMASGTALAAVITPVTVNNNASLTTGGARVVSYFDGTPAAYNTPVTNCYYMPGYGTLDIVYKSASVASVQIDQLYGNDTTVLAAGSSILNSATPVVTPVSVQIAAFNANQCIKVTSADATPIAVYVKLQAR